MKISFYLLLIFIVISSCNKDKATIETSPDYLIFGHFYGMCTGESCIETYKITEDALFEDLIDDYSGQNMEFVALSEEQFNDAADIVNFFPSELLQMNDGVIGCPDCADGGGITIHYFENGNTRVWRIDQVKDNIPESLHSFIDKVNEKIELINN